MTVGDCRLNLSHVPPLSRHRSPPEDGVRDYLQGLAAAARKQFEEWYLDMGAWAAKHLATAPAKRNYRGGTGKAN